MSAPLSGPRELAAGLADALRPALAADAPPLARMAARDVAQLMGLSGLDAALAELERHAGAGRPLEVEHLAARIERTVDEALSAGGVTVFHAADRELGALAAQLAAMDWRHELPAPVPAVASLSVGETLADLAVEYGPHAAEARLTMTVASALRAAIDWLGADETPRARATVHDVALTLTVDVASAGGIGPAGAVLATVEGSLAPEAGERWTLRLPLCSERPAFLLVRQGSWGFALPWHAVARLRMFSPAALETLAEPRLAPLGQLESGLGERPAALLAHGLVHAWFVADRIVWRIAAVPHEPDLPSPFAGADRVVEVDGSKPYWVLDPAWLLRGVTPPEVAPPAPRRRAFAPPEPPSLSVVDATGERAAAEPAEDPNAALAAAVERALDVLRRERAAEAPPSEPAPDAITMASIDAAVDAIVFAPVPESAPAPAAAAFTEPATEEWRVEEIAPAPAQQAPAPAAPAPLEPAPPESTSPASDATDAILFAPARPEPAPAPADAILFAEPPVAPWPSAPRVEPAGPPPAPAPRPSDHAEQVTARRALVVDDSLVARIFLTRLLEQRGWIVETVPDAAGLWAELPHGPWSLVCVDYALPDAQGHGHLARLMHHLAHRATPATCIVLTRDADEERVARDAGATHVLRKPFESAQLDRILAH